MAVLREEAGVELERGGEVFGEVGGVVAAGVDVEFVGDMAGGEDFVERRGAGFEAVVVLVAAVEVNLEAGEIGGMGEGDGAVAIPEGGVGRIAEDAAENAGAGRAGRRGAEEAGKFFDEGGAVCANGTEELRMAEREMESAVATHGDTGDGAVGAAGSGAVAVFDEGEKFLKEKIFVAVFSVARIDVEAGAAVGSGDEEVLELLFFALVFDEVPEAGVDEELFVIAEAVKVVEDGEFLGFVGVERGGEDDAIGDRAREDFGGEGVALDAAGGGGGGEVKEVKEEQEVKEEARHRSGEWRVTSGERREVCSVTRVP